MRTILVVGSANIDLVTRVPRCPKAGETLLGHSFSTVPGGKGANQAVAASRLGARTFFAGCVGNDVFGQMQRETMTEAGIDLQALRIDPEEPTGTAVIFVADEGQNAIVVTPAANARLRPEHIAALKPLVEKADAVMLQLEIPLDTVEATLALARSCGTRGILDAGAAQQVPESLIAKADLVSPNETEAEAMTGIPIHSLDDAHKAAARLRAMGAKEVVMKLGDQGAYYLGEDEAFHVPAFPVKAVDTVAAGDAFTAALTLAWSDGTNKREALRFANAAGALATLKAGAQPSMPSREAVETFLKKQEF